MGRPKDEAPQGRQVPVSQKVVEAMCRRSPAFFAAQMLAGPSDPPFCGRFLVTEHHEAWSRLIVEHDRVCVEAARGHGKCGTRNHLIWAADGRSVPISEWEGGEVFGLNVESGKLGRYYASAAEDNGVVRCYRLRTRTGRATELSEGTPILRFEGWTNVERVSPGDRVAVPRRLPTSAPLALVNSDVLWDEVVAVENIGPQPTWGIEVETTGNYVGDGIVCHNSHFFTLAVPLWDAWRRKSAGMDPPDCMIFSSSQPQAARLLKKIQIQVETNPKLAGLLPPPGARREWSQSGLRLANGYTIAARGYGTKIRGGHPRLIVVDDAFNDNTAYSETVRSKEIDYFFQAIRPMVLPGGKVIIVGTPLHLQDLYAQLAAGTEYEFRRYPAIVERGRRAGQPLWPELFSLSALDSIKREMGSLRFTREYLCNPVGDASSLFPARLFRAEGMERPDLRLGLPLDVWRRLGVRLVAVGVDFGLSASIKSDYTVVWVQGVDERGVRWIMEIYRERGLAYTDQKELIAEAGRRYAADVIFCEANQAQRIFGEELQRETDLPIHLHFTGEAKHSQTKGLPALRVLLENRKFRLPLGDQRSRDLIGAWISEMGAITLNQGKVVSVGEHDDLPAACWIADLAVKASIFGFSFSEEEGDREALDEMLELMEQDEPEPDAVLLGTGAATFRGSPARLVDGAADDVLYGTESDLERQKRLARAGPPFFGAPSAAALLSFGGFRGGGS